jgi:hypothetical protein
MSDKDVMKNFKREPDIFEELIGAEMDYKHTWKNKKSLAALWDQWCDADHDEVEYSSLII